MVAKSQIADIANTVGWRGTPNRRYAEPAKEQQSQVIDNSNPYSSNIRTSIDCYISGAYVTSDGKSFEITQRYSIFVAYNRQTQLATMQQVRNRIISDFEQKYGNSFNITQVYVPNLPMPVSKVLPGLKPGQDVPMEMYFGSRHFKKAVPPHMKARFDVQTEREKAKVNIESIRRRYKYRR
jgi:hypothetical protein